MRSLEDADTFFHNMLSLFYLWLFFHIHACKHIEILLHDHCDICVSGPSLLLVRDSLCFNTYICDLVFPRDISSETLAPSWSMLSSEQLSPALLLGNVIWQSLKIHTSRWEESNRLKMLYRCTWSAHSSFLLGWSCMALCPSWKSWASLGAIFTLLTASSLAPSFQQQTPVGWAFGCWFVFLFDAFLALLSCCTVTMCLIYLYLLLSDGAGYLQWP